MDIIKAAIAFSVSTAVLIMAAFAVMGSEAGGIPGAEQAASRAVMREIGAFDFGECASGAVYECSTGTLLGSTGGAAPLGQLTELMTFLLAAERIEGGELSLTDTVTASKNAFDRGAPQIWLGIGEKISVDELLRAISVGNANDAAYALGEHIAGSAEAFTALMNSRAAELGMSAARFADPTGEAPENSCSAEDMCRLCAELSRYGGFATYFTTWTDSVRGGRAELVSRNRLIRSYSGILGFKVCSSEGGFCGAVCAERGDMRVAAVILGAPDEDKLISRCQSLLDAAFAEFSVYTPEVPEEALEPVPVIHGCKSECPAEIPYLHPIVVKKEQRREIECTFEAAESAEAPVFKGQPLGRIVYHSGEEELISADICAAELIPEVDMKFSFRRVLLNLLNM